MNLLNYKEILMRKVFMLCVAICLQIGLFAELSNQKITALYVVGLPGTYVVGNTVAYKEGVDGHFQVRNGYQGGISIDFKGHAKDLRNSGDDWRLEFHANNQKLQKGIYKNAERAAFSDKNPGLDLSGCGRGYNTLEGEFEVLEIKYNENNKVDVFAANFKIKNSIFGSIRYNSTIPIETCLLELCDNDVNAIIEIEPLEGERVSEFISQSECQLSPWPYGYGISLSLEGKEGVWMFEFGVPCGKEFVRGVYDDAAGYPLEEPSKPWITIVTPEDEQIIIGSFEVIEIRKARNGDLLSLALDFMAEKDNGDSIKGSIRFNSQCTLRFLEPEFLDFSKIEK